jgi:hypothetical protein
MNTKSYTCVCTYLSVGGDKYMELKDRSSTAIRYWIPLAAVTAAITFVLTIVLTHLTLERSIVDSALAGIIVFSGLFFRSVGKDKEKYKKLSSKSL